MVFSEAGLVSVMSYVVLDSGNKPVRSGRVLVFGTTLAHLSELFYTHRKSHPMALNSYPEIAALRSIFQEALSARKPGVDIAIASYDDHILMSTATQRKIFISMPSKFILVGLASAVLQSLKQDLKSLLEASRVSKASLYKSVCLIPPRVVFDTNSSKILKSRLTWNAFIARSIMSFVCASIYSMSRVSLGLLWDMKLIIISVSSSSHQAYSRYSRVAVDSQRQEIPPREKLL